MKACGTIARRVRPDRRSERISLMLAQKPGPFLQEERGGLYAALPIRSEPVDHDLMHNGVLAQCRQVDGRFGDVERINLPAAHNLIR